MTKFRVDFGWTHYILYAFICLNQIEGAMFPEYNAGSRIRRQLSNSQTNFDSYQDSGAQLEKLIPPNYNNLQPPPPIKGAPTKVVMSVILFNVRGIDEEAEQFIIEMNLRMSWQDSRLLLQPNVTDTTVFRVFSPELLNKIWHPDVFIDHSISVKNPAITTPPASLRVYDDNTIRYSARLTVTVACEMDFHLYPMDTQHCPVQLMSYAYPANVMGLAWESKRGAFFSHPLNLANFQVTLAPVQNLVTNTSSASYSKLEFELLLRRNIMYHLIQTYLPSFIFLAISWISLLIPKRNAAERITVCSLTMLSLVVMFGSLGIPKVSYMTALHIWMITCVLFVFASFVEFVLVLKCRGLAANAAKHVAPPGKKEKKKQKRIPGLKFSSKQSFELHQAKEKGGAEHHNKDDVDGPPPSSSNEITSSTGGPKGGHEGHDLSGHHEVHEDHKYLILSRTLDRITIVTLPLLFLVFMICYWSWLLLSVANGK